jgi:hypothetical protein
MTEDDRDPLGDERTHKHNEIQAGTMRACGSPRLVEITAILGEPGEFYRYGQRHDRGRRDAAGEHRAIFEATIGHDLACRLHAEHIQRTAQIATSAPAELELQNNPVAA